MMASDLVYHREASFGDLYRSVTKGLARMMMTKGEVFVLTASGTGAMEAAVANMVNPGDKVLVAISGKFGERWRELGLRYGAYVDEFSRPFGESIPADELERRLLANDSARCVFTTLTETSTGALNDIKAFGDICHRLNRFLVVDAIAGLGADELRTDEWHCDVVVGGSQKGVAAPPGLSFISMSPRAWERCERVKGTRYYFDLRAAKRFADKGQTPWTPAISLFYALDLGLKKLLRTGMTRYWQQHREIADAVRTGVREMGLSLFPQRPSNSLTVIRMPEGVDGTRVVDVVKKGYRELLANGQAEMRGKVVRIGHMGPNSKPEIMRVFGHFAAAYKRVARRGK
jgi:aspartate aminotransferase-like enzyme